MIRRHRLMPESNWRIVTLACVLAMTSVLAAGCGGEDAETAPATIAEIEVEAGPFETEEEFTAAATDFCTQAQAVSARIPVYASWPAGLAKEFEARVELELQYAEQTAAIEAPESLAEDWREFNELQQDVVVSYGEVLAAAEKDDLDGAFAALDDAAPAFDAQTEILERVAPECSGGDFDASEDVEVPEIVTEAPEELQPAGTIEEAAEEFAETMASTDCDAQAAVPHSQNYVESNPDCVADEFLEAAEVVATADYGPVAVALYDDEQDELEPSHAVFILDPADGELANVGFQYAESGGLNPANEGIDADVTAQAAVDAIRDDDPEALTATLSTDAPAEAREPGPDSFAKDAPFDSVGSDPVYGERIVADIREDTEAAPELLAADQVNAYYLLDTESTDYLLVLSHEPGSPTEYRFGAYWALTE